MGEEEPLLVQAADAGAAESCCRRRKGMFSFSFFFFSPSQFPLSHSFRCRTRVLQRSWSLGEGKEAEVEPPLPPPLTGKDPVAGSCCRRRIYKFNEEARSSFVKKSKTIIHPGETDGSVPNTLVVANCEIVKPRVAAAEHISQFNEEARSPFVKKSKTIIHPGEVNRIRELPRNSKIVATHTDSPDVLISDVDAQPNRHAVLGAAESRPDLILTGHKENAEFALGMCPAEPFALSGGKDKLVVLWSIHDHISALGEAIKSPAASSGGKQSAKAGSDKTSESPKVAARAIFQGHSDTVEDVQFAPSRLRRHINLMFTALIGTVTMKISFLLDLLITLFTCLTVATSYFWRCWITCAQICTNLKLIMLLFFVCSGVLTRHLFSEVLLKTAASIFGIMRW